MTFTDIDRTLSELEELARKKGTPTRYHARELLVALGSELVAAREEQEAIPEELALRFERAASIHGALGEVWERAVMAELELACAEHIHSVDPRFLSLPNYDWAYTLAARERLTARLAAAKQLQLAVPELLLGRVEVADKMLDEHLG